MQSDFFSLLESIGREKGLSREILIKTIREALSSAYRKKYGHRPENLRVILDEKEKKLHVLVAKRVVEEVRNASREISLEEAKKIDPDAKVGGKVDVEINPGDFSRIAASTGKYVMMQQIVERERDLLYEEFKKKEGEIISGTVRYRANHFILVDLGKVEGILPEREQLPKKRYEQGQRLKAYILRVTRESKGPRVVLSQTHPNFLRKLFELEVPEIGEKIVEIKDVRRDPGRRAKVVVKSRDEKVDAVGACVGVRGTRIRAILRELDGEKVDIIRYSEDPATFIKNSLKPAEVKEIRIDENSRKAKVIVSDDQLSLAIGTNGENVKLAVKLTGWQIDIRSDKQIEEEMNFLKSLPGVGDKMLSSLREAGFLTAKDIVRGGMEGLCQVKGIGPKIAGKILEEAKKIIR
ncbi:transcription termination/antitermination protein NusA [Candidatus Aerophobetes bacterium]|nr:transcription termination/antitermination protein NusA [Candidatus Aerophobetes bacterium]